MYSRRAFEVLKGVMECKPFVMHDVKYVKKNFSDDVFNAWFNNVSILGNYHIAIDNLTCEIIVMQNYSFFDSYFEIFSSRQVFECIGTLILHVARCHNEDRHVVLPQVVCVHGYVKPCDNAPLAKFSTEDAMIVSSILKGEDVMKMYGIESLNEVVGSPNNPVKYESIKCLTNEIQALRHERNVAVCNAKSWKNIVDIDAKYKALIADASESLTKLRGAWINDDYLIDLEHIAMY
jgi:hypothetical protein